jgi:putative endonuclease
MHGAEDGKEKRSPGARYVNFVMPAKRASIVRASHMTKQPCVYILARKPNDTLYVGVTSDLVRRVWEHKSDTIDGFTKQYRVHDPVYAEFHETMLDAITREKQMKRWRRAWKLRLIARSNPDWRDLSADLAR